MEQLQTSVCGFRWEFRTCVDCGKKFVAKHPKSVRCLDCRITFGRKRSREYYHKKVESGEIELKKDDHNVCKKTKSCKYGGRMGGINICNYLEVTGERRPCPVKDCEVYTRGKQIKKEKVRLYRL